jgi:hypothetical protein
VGAQLELEHQLELPQGGDLVAEAPHRLLYERSRVARGHGGILSQYGARVSPMP